MTEYLSEVKNICDHLTSLGHPVSEKAMIFVAIHGLGRDYEPVITVLEGTIDVTPTPTYESVVTRLVGYDERLRSYNASSQITPHLAFSVT